MWNIATDFSVGVIIVIKYMPEDKPLLSNSKSCCPDWYVVGVNSAAFAPSDVAITILWGSVEESEYAIVDVLS